VVIESSSLSGDAEALARWSPCPDIGAGPVTTMVSLPLSGISEPPAARIAFATKRGYVTEVGDVGPVAGEDGAGVGLDLGMGDDAEPGSLEAHVESSDAGEPAGDGGMATAIGLDAIVGDVPSVVGAAPSLNFDGNAMGTNSTSVAPVASVRASPSDNSGPLPPPSLPSLIRMIVGCVGSVGCRFTGCLRWDEHLRWMVHASALEGRRWSRRPIHPVRLCHFRVDGQRVLVAHASVGLSRP
jgi:hypothetical protein